MDTDYVDNRLYWVDAKLHLIGSSDLTGGNRRVVIADISIIKHPFAISVFEDKVLWSDWGSESISSYSKYGTNNTMATVTKGLHSPMGLRVYHPLAQPIGTDVCASNTCSFLCLPSPAINSRSPAYQCLCADGQQLADDGKTCVDICKYPSVVLKCQCYLVTAVDRCIIKNICGVCAAEMSTPSAAPSSSTSSPTATVTNTASASPTSTSSTSPDASSTPSDDQVSMEPKILVNDHSRVITGVVGGVVVLALVIALVGYLNKFFTLSLRFS